MFISLKKKKNSTAFRKQYEPEHHMKSTAVGLEYFLEQNTQQEHKMNNKKSFSIQALSQ